MTLLSQIKGVNPFGFTSLSSYHTFSLLPNQTSSFIHFSIQDSQFSSTISIPKVTSNILAANPMTLLGLLDFWEPFGIAYHSALLLHCLFLLLWYHEHLVFFLLLWPGPFSLLCSYHFFLECCWSLGCYCNLLMTLLTLSPWEISYHIDSTDKQQYYSHY